jgi:hypothetical protein
MVMQFSSKFKYMLAGMLIVVTMMLVTLSVVFATENDTSSAADEASVAAETVEASGLPGEIPETGQAPIGAPEVLGEIPETPETDQVINEGPSGEAVSPEVGAEGVAPDIPDWVVDDRIGWIDIDSTLPNVRTGQTYYKYINFSASSPVTVMAEIASGELPPGLSLDASTPCISGVPTSSGVYTFAIHIYALDFSVEGTREFTIRVY